MRHIMFATMLAVTVALVACGGDSSEKTPTAVRPGTTPAATAAGATDETPFARTMLLELSDFPPAYVVSGATGAEEPSPLDAFCGSAVEDGRTGRAVSGDFAASAGAASIRETVVVFPDAATATSALERVPARITCAIQAINDGKLDQPTVKFSGAESREAAVAAPGDKHYAYQIRVDGKVDDPAVGTQTVYFLLVYARKGRIGYSLTGTSSGTPFDVSAVTDAAKKAEAKLKQQP